MRKRLFLFSLALVLLISIQPLNAAMLDYYMGAYGDSESIGSIGVRSEIRTHVYRVYQVEEDSFWVGTHLDNGALIEFGYSLFGKSTLCEYGEVGAGNSVTCMGGMLQNNEYDPVWAWAYWLNQSDHYFGIGQISPSELNGTWHLYSITPDLKGEWAFLLDGRQVATARFPPTNSSDAVWILAEKTSTLASPSSLGPVEFRNLAYLRQNGWHNVTELYAYTGCGVNNCGSVAYGVASNGANHIVAGTSLPQSENGALLWSSVEPTPLWTDLLPNVSVLFYGSLIVGVSIIAIFIFLRKRTKTT